MKCPKCNCENTRFREARNNYICDSCDHVFTAESPDKQNMVFISYGHGDEYAQFAYNLADTLIENGYDVFIDRDGIRCGEQWEISLEDGLIKTSEGKGVFLLLMTQHSVRRPNGYCLNEIAYAIDINLKIIPVMLEQVTPPLSIYRLQHYDLLIDPKNDTQIKNYIKKIIQIIENNDFIDTVGNYKSLEHSLNPIDFSKELSLYTKDFVGREWLLSEIEDRISTGIKSLLITGMPGIGKTTMSTYLYQRMPNAIGYYMFRNDDNNKLIFKTFATTIAFQIASQIPEYRTMLLEMKLSTVINQHEGYTLINKLISEPLSMIKSVKDKKSLLIDGLDEAERGRNNAMAIAVSRLINDLPDWINVIVFSRPVTSVLTPLHQASRLEIDADGAMNKEDLKIYIKRHLPDAPQHVIDSIVRHSEGSFIYARYACDNIKVEADYALPDGMTHFYYDSFNRMFTSEVEYASARRYLEWIIASSRPVTQSLIMYGTGCDVYELRSFKDKMKSFIKVSVNDCIQAYHSSLAEWLTNDAIAGEYWISLAEARKSIASVIKRIIFEDLGNFKDLKDYKNRREALEKKIGMKVNDTLFPLYLDVLIEVKDWDTFIDFAIWYIGSVPSTNDYLLNYISDVQDKYIDEFSTIDKNKSIYEAWQGQMAYFIENSTERQTLIHDAYNFVERPVTDTNYIHFLKLYAFPFLRTSFSIRSLEERCRAVMAAFKHMKYDFIHYYSLHDDYLCSCFVDELRDLFDEIAESGKITDPEILQWLKWMGQSGKVK